MNYAFWPSCQRGSPRRVWSEGQSRCGPQHRRLPDGCRPDAGPGRGVELRRGAMPTREETADLGRTSRRFRPVGADWSSAVHCGPLCAPRYQLVPTQGAMKLAIARTWLMEVNPARIGGKNLKKDTRTLLNLGASSVLQMGQGIGIRLEKSVGLGGMCTGTSGPWRGGAHPGQDTSNH